MTLTHYILLTLLTTPLLTACPEADPRCLQCGGDRCLTCIDSFSNTSGICIEVKNKIPGCLTYKNENECHSCKNGFHTNSEGTCSPITIENCVKLDINGDCYLCANKKKPENGKCSSSSCSTEHCRFCTFYNDNEICQVCKDNFVVYPFKLKDEEMKVECRHENGRVINCELARYNDFNECVKCRVNYYYANGKCLKSPDYYFDVGSSYSFLMNYFFEGVILFVFGFIF